MLPLSQKTVTFVNFLYAFTYHICNFTAQYLTVASMYLMSVIYSSSSALLRRATVYNHMGNFQMAAEDLRMVLREEPQNAAATVGDTSTEACCLRASSVFVH